MADAYGMLTLTASEKSQIDFQALINSLNNYSWANDETKWELSSANSICITEHSVQYPSVFTIFRSINANISSTSDDDEDEDDVVSLNELVATLSQHIQSGWIEIAVVSHEKNRYLVFENLKIYSSGKGFRSSRMYGSHGMEKFSESV